MGRLIKFTAAALAVAVLSGSLGYAGYQYFDAGRKAPGGAHRPAAEASFEPEEALAADYADDAGAGGEPEGIPASAIERITLNEDARIVYRYHYLKDGHIDVSSEDAPYFLAGLTQVELAGKMMGWELAEFSPGLAVFEKKINARSTERYTVGIHGGYVTVFYDEEVSGSRVKERTEIPIDALSEEELARLERGISVTGEEQLVKVLEDYGS